ncbi:MAG: DUF4870 domain-containing protein [bacterium]|nr:DUF4870 domain-containing protein [bacterium]
MEQILNLITYIPFVGWFYPMAMKKEDSFAMHHAKQAFVMAVVFSVVLLFFFGITVFLPTDLRVLRLSIVIIIYLLYVLYFVLCVIGTLKIKAGEEYKFPFIKKYTDSFEV